METKVKKERLVWIDAAKALCIILMIIGHTIPYKSHLRAIIYSFHMPLFFILSGYTMKFINDWNYIKTKIKRDFVTLVIPVIVLVIIHSIFSLMTKNLSPVPYLINRLKALFWSVGWDKNTPYIGALWFLISMFYARMMLRVIAKLCTSRTWLVPLIVFVLGIGSVYTFGKYTLPQNFMVNFVAMMFIYVGHLWKKYAHVIREYRPLILGGCLIFWSSCVMCGLYIEMAVQSYPYGLLSIIEAICGTYVACYVMEKLIKLNILKTIFGFIGCHTMTILEIEYLSFLLEYFGPLKWNSPSVLKNTVERLLAIFIIFGIVVMFKKIRMSHKKVEEA